MGLYLRATLMLWGAGLERSHVHMLVHLGSPIDNADKPTTGRVVCIARAVHGGCTTGVQSVP